MKYALFRNNTSVSHDDCAQARGVWTRYDVYDTEGEAIRAANDWVAERIEQLADDLPDGYIFYPETEAVMVVPVEQNGDDFDLPEDFWNSGAADRAYTAPLSIDERAFMAKIAEFRR